MSEKDKGNLFAIWDSLSKIERFTENCTDELAFSQELMRYDAVLMNFIIVGESVARLSETLKKAHPHIPWNDIKGLRNLIAHDYFGTDPEEVWQIVQHHLPTFKLQVEELLDAL
jgi:uncharacterized protein with HEPN domain